MSRLRLTAASLLVLLAFGAALCGGAGAALVAVNDLVLRADGGFRPLALPRQGFAPIRFQGYFDIAAKGGGKPVALEQAVIDFDRDGRLDVSGLPTCQPQLIAEATAEAARQACSGAVVGSGRIEAIVASGNAVFPISAPLTIFNGPPIGGNPTAILHARTSFPQTETYMIVAPIERRPGPFRYRVTLDTPPIADGLGAISRVEVDVGRRFGPGNQRSYVAARCSDGVLDTHGRFTFADGTVIDGSVEKGCRVKRPS
ncbi:MAG: hypothetical protein ABW065_08535 [Solirubrobacterales bacterium]